MGNAFRNIQEASPDTNEVSACSPINTMNLRKS